MKILSSAVLLFFFYWVSSFSYSDTYTFVKTVWEFGTHPFTMPKKLKLKTENHKLVVESSYVQSDKRKPTLSTLYFFERAGTPRNIDPVYTRVITLRNSIDNIHALILFFDGSKEEITRCDYIRLISAAKLLIQDIDPKGPIHNICFNFNEYTYVSSTTVDDNPVSYAYTVSIIIVGEWLTLTLVNKQQPDCAIKGVYQHDGSSPQDCHTFVK